MAKRIVVDPITRIEGHLRIDVEVDGGSVKNAWSSAQMFRGIETILKGRDPRDAWVFAQRFCGVCTTVHAISSVRCIEDALQLEVPLNAQYIRNMIVAAHAIQDNIVHFYHLSALDWVDMVNALKADPVKAAQIASSYSSWSGNSVNAFIEAKERLQNFVNKGRLGIFGTGYWGHPAMKLPPEVNLIAFAHYLKALDYQRMASKYVAVLGGKDPHIQNLCVGGVATAINMDNTATFNMERAALLQGLMTEVGQFVKQVYLPDVLTIGSFYPEWFTYGAGDRNYMAVPEFPMDTRSTTFQDIGGMISGGDLSTFKQIKDWNDLELRNNITENTDFAWYSNSKETLHPYEGETIPKYTDKPDSHLTGFADDARYTWCKAPRFNGKPFEVGPIAQILAAYAAKDPRTTKIVDASLATAKIQPKHLCSTLGRHVARAIRAALMVDRAEENLTMMLDNIGRGDSTYANPLAEIPKGSFRGVGFHEAPRGVLSHWVVIEDQKIGRYQSVVPSTWNAGPKDRAGNYGPYEASLLGNPVAIPDQPLEVLRTVHSFDPCIACAVHTVDPEGKEIVKITVE